MLLVSFDLDEIFDLSDRILIIFQGKIVGDFPSGRRRRAPKLGLLMGGKVAVTARRANPCRLAARAGVLTLMTALTSVAGGRGGARWSARSSSCSRSRTQSKPTRRCSRERSAAAAPSAKRWLPAPRTSSAVWRLRLPTGPGLFNIGIEGQMIMGGLAAGLFAAWNFELAAVHLFATGAAGCRDRRRTLGRDRRGAQGDFRRARSDHHDHAQLSRLSDRQLTFCCAPDDWLPVNPQLQSTETGQPGRAAAEHSQWHAPARRVVARPRDGGVVWYFLFRTSFGYQLRTVGISKGAAAYAGMSWGATITLAMFISGALGGLGGSSETLGLLGQQYNAPQGYGFASIAVGLVGRNNPFGVVLAALLFGALAQRFDRHAKPGGHSKELVLVLQGLVILPSPHWRHRDACKPGGPSGADTGYEDYSDTIGVEPGVQPEL